MISLLGLSEKTVQHVEKILCIEVGIWSDSPIAKKIRKDPKHSKEVDWLTNNYMYLQ